MRMALGGSATASASAPKSDTKYSYNPETMKYTQVDTTAPAASNTMQDSVRKFYGPALGGGAFGMGLIPQAFQNALAQKNAAPQPTTTTQTMGGMAAPYTPSSGLAAVNTSMVPNIQMQPQQNVDQQLGLQAFYPMMEQQLALKGSNLQAQGYANGGMGFTPEGQAKRDYLKSTGMGGQNGPRGVMRTIPDDEWARIKKENNISIPSAASAAPAYNYNPATMQYTDNAGKVTGGMEQQFMPPMMMQQLTPEEQIGLTGYQGYAEGGTANGGYSLGSYSDGGQLLKGPGDGISDSIPAQIGSHQPARLANNEFVIPARIVSEIGNGSTDAGARRLYEMMDRVQKRRKKTVGKGKVAVDSGAHKELARL
jgi:hypothetical protein